MSKNVQIHGVKFLKITAMQHLIISGTRN